MHACRPSSVGEREKLLDRVGKAAHLFFPDSRFHLGQGKNRNVIEAPAVHAPLHSLQAKLQQCIKGARDARNDVGVQEQAELFTLLRHQQVRSPDFARKESCSQK
jgi:hypothetical protein